MILKKLYHLKVHFLIFLKSHGSLCMVLVLFWMMKWILKKHLTMSLQLVEMINEKLKKKQNLWTWFFSVPREEIHFLKSPWFLTSKKMPLSLKPSQKPDLDRDDPLTSQMSPGELWCKSQSALLYMVSTLYKFQLNPNRYNRHYVSYAS